MGSAPGIIALLTDFGTADWFVAAMKAVIAGICPRATFIDITHEVPAGDIRAGAFVLLSCFRTFPPGTVFLAVVDPGVGGSRCALIAQTREYVFVGPDNGLLSFALRRSHGVRVHEISDEKMRHPLSATFHGRDIFAPAAAHVLRGVRPRSLGAPVSSFIELPWPTPVREKEKVSGRVVYIDRFGNAITSIDEKAIGMLSRPPSKASVGGCRSIPFESFYEKVEPGKPLAVVGSEGFVEISINQGNAAHRLGLRVGDLVRIG